ncbi:FliA/WhiG family RNA polymerase sigma factor [Pradoshia sp.]
MLQVNVDEEQLYWHRWLDGRDEQAGDILAKKYVPLVNYHVSRISVSLPRNVCRDEVRSLGLMGLFDALEKFDLSRDLKFETYASFRIRGAIIDGLRKEDWLPRSTREKVKLIEATIVKLEQKRMRNISVTEVAQELGLREDEVNAASTENYYANVISMDERPKNQNEETPPFDRQSLTPEETLLKKEMLFEVNRQIRMLGEKEQTVLDLFYHKELTLTEIGQSLNLSTSRISQIHSRALCKLRNVLRKYFIHR